MTPDEGQMVAAVIAETVTRAVDPILARLADIENGAVEPILTRLAAVEAREQPTKCNCAEAVQGVEAAIVAIGRSVDAQPAALERLESKMAAAIQAATAAHREVIEDLRQALHEQGAELERLKSVVAAIEELPAPKDGVGVSGAVIDRAGDLVFTLTDGTMRSVGRVVGRDSDPEFVRELVLAEVAKIPIPKDGVDGFNLEDFDVKHDGERQFTFVFERGALRKERTFALAAVLYRGVFAEGKTYEPGDSVTWGGSQWIAKEATSEKPGLSKAWQLAVKHGRDGKPGPKGDKGDPGGRH